MLRAAAVASSALGVSGLYIREHIAAQVAWEGTDAGVRRRLRLLAVLAQAFTSKDIFFQRGVRRRGSAWSAYSCLCGAKDDTCTVSVAPLQQHRTPCSLSFTGDRQPPHTTSVQVIKHKSD
eukprot:1150751-Pelagomonas_calceolata.AAC.7